MGNRKGLPDHDNRGERLSHRHERRPEKEFTEKKLLGQAELVQTLAQDGLNDVARSTVSCVHYPLRTRKGPKQCGICPACISRRQALLKAGIEENVNAYQYDLWGKPKTVNRIAPDKLNFLKATVMQVSRLAHLDNGGPGAELFRRHVVGTGMLAPNELPNFWYDVLKRYRDEWLEMLTQGRTAGYRWAAWLNSTNA